MNKAKRHKVGNWIGWIVSILLIATILFFAGVMVFFIIGQYHDGQSEDGRLYFGVSKVRRKAFCYSCEWHGGDMTFVIPDEFMGYPVTTLGGYIGRGFPCPFGVRVNTDDYNSGWGEEVFEDRHRADDEFENLTFSIQIGANVKKFDGIAGKVYLVNRTEIADGEYDEDVIYKVVYFLTVDEKNKTFYAEDGRLYYRSSGEMVEDFFYA